MASRNSFGLPGFQNQKTFEAFRVVSLSMSDFGIVWNARSAVGDPLNSTTRKPSVDTAVDSVLEENVIVG